MRIASSVLAIALLIALSAGCGGKTPPSHYYRLAPPGGGASPGTPPAPDGIRELEVGIAAFIVDPPYDQDQLVFRVGRRSPEVGFHPRDRWAAPLAHLLPALLSERLMEVVGAFVTVGPPAGRPLDARIEGHVKALEEIVTPQGTVAYFKAAFTLRNRAGEALWTETVESEAPVKGDGGTADVVRAMETAVLEAMGRARAGLSGALLGMARASEG